MQSRYEQDSWGLEQAVAGTNVTFSTPREAIDKLNHTLWTLVNSKVANAEESTSNVITVLNATPTSQMHIQSPSAQDDCAWTCRGARGTTSTSTQSTIPAS